MNRAKKMFVKYKTVNDILSLYRRNRPISVVQCKNGKIYAIVQYSQGILYGLEAKVSFLKSINSLAMNFHQVILNDKKTDEELKQVDDRTFTRYILLLPELSKLGYYTISGYGSYYIIDSEWNELSHDMKFVTPKAPYCKY